MRILQVINNLGSGGAEKLISDFVPLMKDRGHDIEILLLRKKGSIYIDDLLKKGIKVTCLSENNLYSLFHVIKIRNFIKKGGYDVVNVHIFPALYFVSLASLFGIGGVKLIFTEHSTHNKRMSNTFFKIIDKFIYKRYNKIIAITNDVKDAIDKHLNVKNKFSVVINNGVDIKKFEMAIPVDLSSLYEGYTSKDKILCMVGRFSEAKDQNTIIKSLTYLPDNIKLLLVGEGNLMDESKKLVSVLKLDRRVHFLGVRKDIPQILKACDIGILSSNWEGMPISALEIFASGIPFVGSNVSGIKDLFMDRESDLHLFDNKNEKQLSDLIKILLEDDNIRKKNINICKNIVNKFSLEKMTDSYLHLYSNLITKKML